MLLQLRNIIVAGRLQPKVRFGLGLDLQWQPISTEDRACKESINVQPTGTGRGR
jgi:hypothetical protein